jgi:cobyrinic acid a,c-diamide synthase
MYDPLVRHAGAILNRIGGPSHADAVKAACARAGIEVLAAIPHRESYAFPERRLGLDRASFERSAVTIDRVAAELAAQLDVEALLAAATPSQPLPPAVVAAAISRHTRVAYAEDDAFWFTYPETLDALRAAGAEVVPFSPLADRDLPRDAGAIWIGGGYPEDHARQLESNAPLRRALREAVDDGIPVYAECGGLMYLAEELRTADGVFAMAGAIEGATSMAEPRLHIGYREATVASSSPFDSAGTVVRGYEFHYATPLLRSPMPAYVHAGGADGAVRGNCVAAFLHRHFLPGDAAVEHFVRHSDSRNADG